MGHWRTFIRCMAALVLTSVSAAALAAGSAATLPTGQAITPAAAPGGHFGALNPDLPGLPGFTAGQAAAAALSPDGRTLAILTSGYNRNNGPDGKPVPALSNEYVFFYDIGHGPPVKRQVLPIANSFLGLAWAPAGDRLFVSGGVDDAVVVFDRTGDLLRQAGTLPLGHKAGLGIEVKPAAAGLAVSPDGAHLLVANAQNDSVSLIDLKTGSVSELDLRPGGGRTGGSFPRAVAWVTATKAYVAAERDRELIALTLTDAGLRIGARIATRGQPVAFAAAKDGRRLYAVLDNTDAVLIIDPQRDAILESIPTAGPGAPIGLRLGGAGSNSAALSSDGRTLYVTNGGENALAVIALGQGARRSRVLGLIPTGWYPTGVAVSPTGKQLFVVNAKSNAGPNPGACRDSLNPSKTLCEAVNGYVWQLEKAGFLALPTPRPVQLARLTRQVMANNHAGAAERIGDRAMMSFLKGRIHHVIYVVKENRTYDQVLGDLGMGDSDARLALFPPSIALNHHRLARQFVDLDRFFDSGESSNTGWNWTTAGRTNDWTEREAPVNYAGRGLQYDQEGENRNVNVGIASPAGRHAARAATPADPDLLAGGADVAAPDGPDGDEGHGYLWDAALKAGLSVRNWGFYGDLSRYDPDAQDAIPLDRDPARSGRQVFFTTKASLQAVTDPYYRGFDQAFPDYWRVKEWRREFDQFQQTGQAPTLMLLRLPHDHFGSFATGIDGVNTVETEMADNDYALGLVVQSVAQSRFAADTLIFVVEDDAQDGADHVDAHRSIAFVIGPYVKQGAVVSTPYTTVDMIRTIEDILGLGPMGLNDARARPMTAVFDRDQSHWTYEAAVPPALRAANLPLPPLAAGEASAPLMRSSAYWTRVMAGQNFKLEDHLDTKRFNAALWRGLKGETETTP